MSGSIKGKLALPKIEARNPKRNDSSFTRAEQPPAIKPRAGSQSNASHLPVPAAVASQLAWTEPVLRPEKGVLGLNLGLRRLESFLAEIHVDDVPDPLTRLK